MDDTHQIQKLCAAAMLANATKRFAVKCPACGKKQTRNLHWLQSHKFKCPTCGGNLDEAPLHQITKEVLQEMRGHSKTSKPWADKKSARRAPLKRHEKVKECQLVLQFRGDSLADLDDAVALEEDLIRVLGDSADVDGHDVGSGETNIFILTSDPADTFRQAMPVLKRRKSMRAVTAAYRPVDGEQFTVIWPESLPRKFAVK